MCRSMVDIQSVAAEIRRGKKKKIEDRQKETTGQKYNGPLLQGGHKYATHNLNTTQIYVVVIVTSDISAFDTNFECSSLSNVTKVTSFPRTLYTHERSLRRTLPPTYRRGT